MCWRCWLHAGWHKAQPLKKSQEREKQLVASPLKEGPLFPSRNKIIFASSRALFSALQAKGLTELLARLSEGGF